MNLEAILHALSTDEKLEAMNILWRDLAKTPKDVLLPDWHGQVLAGRAAHPSPNAPLPLDAAIEDVKDRLNARRTQG